MPMAKYGRFGSLPTPRDHFWWFQSGPTSSLRCGKQCSTLFIQCSTQIGQLGPSVAKFCQIWPEIAVLGAPETTRDHFWWVQRGATGPPICEVQCSTLLNRCLTQIGQLRPLKVSQWCQTWKWKLMAIWFFLRAGTSRWKGTRGEERRRKKIMAVLLSLSGEEWGWWGCWRWCLLIIGYDS